jgi:hypothetical protein
MSFIFLSEPRSCCFSAAASLTLHPFTLFLFDLAQPLSTKIVSQPCWVTTQKLGNFWSSGFELRTLFATARTLCHYVCVLASSSNIQLCLCTRDYPALPNMRKELLLCYHATGNVLILEFNLQWWFSYQHVISIDLYFPPTLLSLNMLKH